MEWNWKEFNKEKTLFRSYYCSNCKQSKPCQLLTGWDSEWKSCCCSCYFQNEQGKAQEYISYEKVLESKQKEKQETLKELKRFHFWKATSKCSYCGKKAIQPDWLLKGELVCLECSKGHNEMCWSSQEKFYWKYYGINLGEWLEEYQRLPVNKKCAREWVRDKEHLKNCQCLEKEVKELVELFSGSLQEIREKLKECSCIKSEKVRVDSDYYAWCERCEKSIKAASKKRVIKNRNDVRFWGVESKWKVLCLRCIGKEFYKRMVDWQRKKWREYLRRGYV